MKTLFTLARSPKKNSCVQVITLEVLFGKRANRFLVGWENLMEQAKFFVFILVGSCHVRMSLMC